MVLPKIILFFFFKGSHVATNLGSYSLYWPCLLQLTSMGLLTGILVLWPEVHKAALGVDSLWKPCHTPAYVFRSKIVVEGLSIPNQPHTATFPYSRNLPGGSVQEAKIHRKVVPSQVFIFSIDPCVQNIAAVPPWAPKQGSQGLPTTTAAATR